MKDFFLFLVVCGLLVYCYLFQAKNKQLEHDLAEAQASISKLQEQVEQAKRATSTTEQGSPNPQEPKAKSGAWMWSNEGRSSLEATRPR